MLVLTVPCWRTRLLYASRCSFISISVLASVRASNEVNTVSEHRLLKNDPKLSVYIPNASIASGWWKMPGDISGPRSTRELTTTHTENRRTGGMAYLFSKPKFSNYHQAARPGLNSTPSPYEGCHAPGKPCFEWTVTDWCEQLQRSETHAHSTV